jgi:hypothetical protein
MKIFPLGLGAAVYRKEAGNIAKANAPATWFLNSYTV